MSTIVKTRREVTVTPDRGFRVVCRMQPSAMRTFLLEVALATLGAGYDAVVNEEGKSLDVEQSTAMLFACHGIEYIDSHRDFTDSVPHVKVFLASDIDTTEWVLIEEHTARGSGGFQYRPRADLYMQCEYMDAREEWKLDLEFVDRRSRQSYDVRLGVYQALCQLAQADSYSTRKDRQVPPTELPAVFAELYKGRFEPDVTLRSV